jgi:hypothetical protein
MRKNEKMKQTGRMRVVYVLSTCGGGIPYCQAELANAVAKLAEVIVVKPEKTTGDNIFSEDIGIVNAFKMVWRLM